MNLLSVKNLNINFYSQSKELSVVKDISFQVKSGEILSIVGESGCGKSISCLALTKLLPSMANISASSIEFDTGKKVIDLSKISNRELRKVRGGGIAYIFQEPSVSLNPVFTIGDQIAEVLSLHRPEVKDLRKEIIELLIQVGIPSPEMRIKSYPHELSGGMQQRIMIAMALAGNPRLLIADEPTTALDVTIQAQILELIARIRKERNMGVILITHNLGIVANLADNVAVMYAGNIVEYASSKELIENPCHPYTIALLQAVPKLFGSDEKLKSIPGQVPSPDKFSKGCRFCDRCEYKKTLSLEDQSICESVIPEMRIENSHGCLCHYSNTLFGCKIL